MRGHPGLVLLQNSDDLFFRIEALLHQQFPHSIYERTSLTIGRYFREQVKSSEDSHTVEVSWILVRPKRDTSADTAYCGFHARPWISS